MKKRFQQVDAENQKQDNALHEFRMRNAMTDEVMHHICFVKVVFCELRVRQRMGMPYDYHERVVSMRLGQGIQAAFERILLNRQPLTQGVLNMVVAGALAEALKRNSI